MNRMKVVQKKPMRKTGIGFLAVLATAYVVHAQAPTGGLDPAAVQELLKQFNVPGVSIAVIKDFKIDWAQGYGVADVETGAPVTPDTMFQAASISKPVAAMASLQAGAGRPLHARSGRQHDPEVVEAAGRRVHEGSSRSRRAG